MKTYFKKIYNYNIEKNHRFQHLERNTRGRKISYIDSSGSSGNTLKKKYDKKKMW